MDKLLLAIRTELNTSKGQLKRISRETGIGYDTVQRIRDKPEYEPGHFKVVKLAEYFKIDVCKDEQ